MKTQPLQRWLIVTLAIFTLALNASCSKPSYDRIEVPGWFSVDYPKGFEHSISPSSMGSSPELDIVQTFSVTLTDTKGNPVTSSATSIEIFVYGVNGSYSDVVDYDNTVASLTKGRLTTKGQTLSVFKWQYPANEGLGQDIYIVRDMGNLRSGVVWGNTKSMTKSAMDTLTRYCTDMANSLTASPSWTSNGMGP
jgi:hypothetical protein